MKRKAGRPKETGYTPADSDRQMVELLTGLGIPQSDIVSLLVSPTSKKPISEVTLRKHFPDEIRTGLVKVKLKIATNLLSLSKNNAAAAIFLGKVRLGMRETIKVEHSGKVGTPNLTLEQVDARITTLLQKAHAREHSDQPTAARKSQPRRTPRAGRAARAARAPRKS